jgi:hypothetical protein
MVISMRSSLTPIDISNIPELVRMAQEVNTAKKSRVLTISRRTLAVLMPVETTRKSKEKRDVKPRQTMKPSVEQQEAGKI